MLPAGGVFVPSVLCVVFAVAPAAVMCLQYSPPWLKSCLISPASRFAWLLPPALLGLPRAEPSHAKSCFLASARFDLVLKPTLHRWSLRPSGPSTALPAAATLAAHLAGLLAAAVFTCPGCAVAGHASAAATNTSQPQQLTAGTANVAHEGHETGATARARAGSYTCSIPIPEPSAFSP
jgi:hypothetical protein